MEELEDDVYRPPPAGGRLDEKGKDIPVQVKMQVRQDSTLACRRVHTRTEWLNKKQSCTRVCSHACVRILIDNHERM